MVDLTPVRLGPIAGPPFDIRTILGPGARAKLISEVDILYRVPWILVLRRSVAGCARGGARSV